MRAGTLRHRIDIQAATVSAVRGDPVKSWATVATVWCNYEPMADWQRAKLPEKLEGSTGRVTLRYYAGLTSQHRFLFKGRVLHIGSVVNRDERNREMVCTVTENEPEVEA